MALTEQRAAASEREAEYKARLAALEVQVCLEMILAERGMLDASRG